MHRRARVGVRLFSATIVHFIVVDGEKSLVGMLVRPDFQIDALLIEKIFQREPVEEGHSAADERLVLCAVVPVEIGAVHGSVTESDDPRTLLAVLVGFDQVLLEPLILLHHLLESVLEEVVEFGRDGDYVGWTDVKTVYHTLHRVWHRKAGTVIAEVAVKLKIIYYLCEMLSLIFINSHWKEDKIENFSSMIMTTRLVNKTKKHTNIFL